MAAAGIGDRVEGVHAVAAAIEAGRVTHLIVEKARLRSPDIEAIVAAARSIGARVEVVDSVVDLAFTDSPQGIVAEARPVRPTSLEDAVSGDGPASLLVLDHFQDPRNIGAAARSAAAAGIGALVVPIRRSAPLTATAFKSAAGGLEKLKIVTVSSIPDTMARLRDLGVWLVGLAADADQSLFGLELLAEPVAVIVGAEGKGMSRLVADRVDVTAGIPLAAGMESLNASVAAALAVFEVQRVRAAAEVT